MSKWQYLCVWIEVKPQRDGKTYAYKVDYQELKQMVPITDYLNRMGEDGWELVQIVNDRYFFKRQT